MNENNNAATSNTSQSQTEKSSAPAQLSSIEAKSKDRAGAMEVSVDHNIEKAMKVLKRKMIKEGIFRELKSRRYYEKPSDKKKRKLKESLKKIRKEQARSKKNSGLLF